MSQPNFEKVKTAFYRAFVNSTGADMSVAMESLCGRLLPRFDVRKEQFKKDFNSWLDGIDIRCAGELIKVLSDRKITIPGWIKRGEFTIDYNESGTLDLIRIENE